MLSLRTSGIIIVVLLAIYTRNVESQEKVDAGNPAGQDVTKSAPDTSPTKRVTNNPDSTQPGGVKSDTAATTTASTPTKSKPDQTMTTKSNPDQAITTQTKPQQASTTQVKPQQSSTTQVKPQQSSTTNAKPSPDNTVDTAPGKPGGRRRKPTNRRRQRKRRPRPENGNKQNGQAKGKVNIPDIQAKPSLKSGAQEVISPDKKTASNGNGKQKKNQADPFDFDFFGGEHTTPEPDPNAPPPHFTIQNQPGKKVMPTLGPYRDAHDGTPCNETYRPHANISTKYMMKYADDQWIAHDCPPNLGAGLVWRQDQCACGEELLPMDPDDWCGNMGFKPHPQNRNRYTRKNHGVDALMDCAGNLIWSQKKCQCIFDPSMKERAIENKVTFTCKTILQLEFEGDLKNTAVGYHVETVDLRRRGKLPRIRFRQIEGSQNKAAMIVSQPLEFLAFRGNDFQTQVTYSLAFKISPRHQKKTNPMTLITDECYGNPGQNKLRPPSIALSFVPSTRVFRLQFRTGVTEIDQQIEGAKPDIHGWYKVVVYFEDQTVNLESGGTLLFTQKDVQGKIPQNKCPLYIAGRGQGFDRSMDFYGYLDSVYLIKDCKFHEANIKFL